MHLLLDLAREYLRQSQNLTAEIVTMKLHFNHGQCRYLVKKLEMAVKSAEDKDLSVSMEDWKGMGKWKFLVRLAMDVESFVQECCKEVYWIQAACMLMNAFEHVASLSSDLELCIWSFENSNRTILATALRRELTTISDAHDRSVLDQVNLLKKVEVALNLGSLSNLQGRQLATSLLGRLEAVLAGIPIADIANLAELSVRDRVNLLNKVEAGLSSDSISNPEEYQLATSLAGRFIASVIGPVSDKPLKDFMRVDCEGLERGEMLGKGSFGEVYKVKWLGTPAAEKTMPGKNEGNLPDFDREVSILARQSHPYIVRLLCYVKGGRNCSIVQELMDKDLSRLIEERMELDKDEAREIPRKFPFSVDEVVNIMLQIAEGMDYLHRRKVLHRDLKPSNILVKCKKLEGADVEFVHTKVADFGTSKTKERSVTLSHPTWNVGTTRWMAPELIRFRPRGSTGNQTGDWYPEWNPFKSDVYSFGMVCYQILTGNEPFVGDAPSTLKQKVLQDKRPPLPPDYPFCLRSMIQKCWRPEPMERPTFGEICRELRYMKGSLLIGKALSFIHHSVISNSGISSLDALQTGHGNSSDYCLRRFFTWKLKLFENSGEVEALLNSSFVFISRVALICYTFIYCGMWTRR